MDNWGDGPDVSEEKWTQPPIAKSTNDAARVIRQRRSRSFRRRPEILIGMLTPSTPEPAQVLHQSVSPMDAS